MLVLLQYEQQARTVGSAAVTMFPMSRMVSVEGSAQIMATFERLWEWPLGLKEINEERRRANDRAREANVLRARKGQELLPEAGLWEIMLHKRLISYLPACHLHNWEAGDHRLTLEGPKKWIAR